MAKTSQFKVAKSSRTSAATHNDQITDPRFTNIQTDPRFRLPSKKNSRVQIDKRFKHVLQDEAFSSRAKVDRYGRRLPKDAGKKELEKYYSFDGDEESLSEDGIIGPDLKKATPKAKEDSSSSTEESSSDEESDVDGSEEDEVFGLLEEHEPGGGAIPVGKVTSRIAVVNLDWDNIRAADLMAVFSSFVPVAGAIQRISIYPSDFGKERIQKEEMEGPPKEIFSRDKTNSTLEEPESDLEDQDEDASSPEEDDEQIKKSLLREDTSQDFNSAKLRRYQLERLRYYYAVLICSSPSVAQTIYEAVDGTEYLTTANFFDLRFVPDDVDFSADESRDECLRIPDGYRPNEFVTDALQHSKVKLTWDADDGTRKEAQKRAFSASRANIDENDLKAYLGSDSSDEETEIPEPVVIDATTVGATESPAQKGPISSPPPKISKKDAERQRMRTLLGLDAKPVDASKKSNKSDPAPVGDLQITFSSGLTSSSQPNQSVFANSPEDREETTVEKYVRKEKERKARRKSRSKASTDDTPNASSINGNEANDEDIKDDGDRTQDLGFSDPFFADPDSVKTSKTTAERKEAKRLRKAERAAEEAANSAHRAELELLTMDDDATTTTPGGNNKGVRHFDMKEIVKAEKATAKIQKSKRGQKRLSEREKEALKSNPQDGFRIDAQDPRFDAVYQRAEFAIDPSHPRYQATPGMKALLEEGRKKRKRGNDELDEGNIEHGKESKRREKSGEEVAALVAKMKVKSKRKPASTNVYHPPNSFTYYIPNALLRITPTRFSGYQIPPASVAPFIRAAISSLDQSAAREGGPTAPFGPDRKLQAGAHASTKSGLCLSGY
ncbi:MAG: hypothetical protein Q9168_004298 [Polycauliona sp. 1 TL-2023]